MGAITFTLDQPLIRELQHHLRCTHFVETGTFRGDSLEVARALFTRCLSVEMSPEYHEAARRRFATSPNVLLLLGDSPAVLRAQHAFFANEPTLFWLDAHWCAAENTAGEKSQCPLLDELAAIGHLHQHSAILIDDARLFLSPPPKPHEISAWPSFDAVQRALNQLSTQHSLVCFNDVLVFVPTVTLPTLRPFLHEHTVNLLTLADKARDYDSLLAQAKAKDQEIEGKDRENISLLSQAKAMEQEIKLLHATATERLTVIQKLDVALSQARRTLTELGHDPTRTSPDLTALMEEVSLLRVQLDEARRQWQAKDQEIQEKDRENNSLLAHAKAKDREIQEKDRENGSLLAHAKAKDREIQEKDRENNSLLAHAKAKDREIELLHATATERLTVIHKLDVALSQARRTLTELGHDPTRTSPDLTALMEEVSLLRIQLDETRRQLQAKDQEIEGKGRENNSLLAQAISREKEIKLLQATATERLAMIHKLDEARRQLQTKVTRQNKPNDGIYSRSNKASVPFPRRLLARWQNRFVEASLHPLGRLQQYPPRPVRPERYPRPPRRAHWPRICIITPSYQQGQFLERTVRSVIDQGYPNLAYGVQDGGSTDGSADLIMRYLPKLAHSESAQDDGQASAIKRGFEKLYPQDEDIMAWLNSDDLLCFGSLAFVGEYFRKHPEVDVVYGHRIIIDEADHEVGRWYLPQHHSETLRWVDFVPQETLFWRARRYREIGGVDPTYQFAMDWDLLLRLEAAGCTIRRLPYFLGCFRVHPQQKTSAKIATLGEQEMQRLRQRTHGRDVAHWEISRHHEEEARRSAWTYWLHRHGLRW